MPRPITSSARDCRCDSAEQSHRYLLPHTPEVSLGFLEKPWRLIERDCN